MDIILPNGHAIVVMLLTVLALILFSRDSIPLETSGFTVLVLLALFFHLFPYETPFGEIAGSSFFSGFGHQALIAVVALMVAGHGIVRTGALEQVGRALARHWNRAPRSLFLVTLCAAASMSAFINNTPIVILLLPILVSVSLKSNMAAGTMLMPMGFATLLGGTATTIGTSTNLLVVSVAADLGLREISMFDFFLPAVIAGAVGVLYLWLIAPRLLPASAPMIDNEVPKIFSGQLHVTPGSAMEGRSIRDIIAKAGKGLRLQHIVREGGRRIVPLPDVRLQAGDCLLVHDTAQNLKEHEQVLGVSLASDDLPLSGNGHDQDLQLAEVIVNRESPLRTRTLGEMQFAERWGVVTLAIHRGGKPIQNMPGGIANVRLRVGDVLLVQGSREALSELKSSALFLVLDNTTDLPHSTKAPVALAIMAGIVLFSALGNIPIAISASAGAAMMILTGCLRWRDVGRAVSAQVIFVIVTSLALGSALLQTGGSDFIASLFANLMQDAPAPVVLAGLIFMMALLTNVVSNNAAAVIGTPIAVSIATALKLNPEPFVLGVLFGANLSYVTPVSYQTNLLVMSAGNYSFKDFVRVGLPLAVLMWGLYTFLLVRIYGL
ncbi:SLC13 family permease [Granulosicoccaceae sp. 1_MG-2023]|nr:SLC13 family permease [Granulosicoccaceae sp. 1_MG-2023]